MRRIIKRGAPPMAVIIPTGSSVVPKIILAKVSAVTIIKAPPKREKRRRFLCLGPTTNRIMWGTINPTNPIIPQKATVTEVAKVESPKRRRRIRLTETPTERAEASSKRRISSSLVSKVIGSNEIRETPPITANFSQLAVEKLPMVHCMMLWSWVRLRYIKSDIKAERRKLRAIPVSKRMVGERLAPPERIKIAHVAPADPIKAAKGTW
jgi:hypothetical protein